MAGHNEPRLLYTIDNVQAHHLQNGEESSLMGPSGPQTLSLLMVSTASPFADLSSANPQSEAPEEDFYLHLHLPPELDLPLPATTQIFHQPPTSYLIPRLDLGPDSGAFTRIEFPPLGGGPGRVTQEDIDTFETILAQCTAFLERANPPTGKGGYAPYNPAAFKEGEGYAGEGVHRPHAGQIVLIDEENGSVVGELSEGFNVVEDPRLTAGSKNPVEIQLPAQGNDIGVSPASEEYLKLARHPAYKDSRLVSNAAVASRLIVTGSTYLSNALSSGAETFTQKVKPNPEPMTFTPTAQGRVRKLHSLSTSAAGLSAKTVGTLSRHAQNLGASVARKGDRTSTKKGAPGGKDDNYKPGILNKSMIAFSTIADGVDHAGRQLLNSGSTAATTVVGHRYGPDAANVAGSLAGGVKNVGLVYIDAAGVSRRAVIKSVAKGMVIGKVRGGGEIVVGAGDGGAVPASILQGQDQKSTSTTAAEAKNAAVGTQALPGMGQPGVADPGAGVVGFGNAAPPAYDSGLGEPLGSQGLQGQEAPPRKF
ncbi:MAG: hypothetical protein M1819_000637 [Sarea resinae]|nr:MAG: hypothetical protein M1819_000637 [Sarea resinae]